MVNSPLKVLTAGKILPMLDLLAKLRRVLACLCSPHFCSCSQARFLVSTAQNFVNPSLGNSKCSSVWCLMPINMAIKSSGNACDKGQR